MPAAARVRRTDDAPPARKKRTDEPATSRSARNARALANARAAERAGAAPATRKGPARRKSGAAARKSEDGRATRTTSSRAPKRASTTTGRTARATKARATGAATTARAATATRTARTATAAPARTTPARSTPAPARRKSGATPQPRHASPVARIVHGRGGAVLDGLLRGRAWVVIVGALLAGIVFLNVGVLELNRGIAFTDAQADSLERKNSDLRSRIADLDSGERIQRLAEQRGFVLPQPGAVTYIRPRAKDSKLAAHRITTPDTADDASLATGTTTTPPAATTTTTTTDPAATVTTPPTTTAAPVTEAPETTATAPVSSTTTTPAP